MVRLESKTVAVHVTEHLKAFQLCICTPSALLIMAKIQVPHEVVLSTNGMFLVYSWAKVMLKFPRRVYFVKKKHESLWDWERPGQLLPWIVPKWASSVALREANSSAFGVTLTLPAYSSPFRPSEIVYLYY